jgi:hypothetical protein
MAVIGAAIAGRFAISSATSGEAGSIGNALKKALGPNTYRNFLNATDAARAAFNSSAAITEMSSGAVLLEMAQTEKMIGQHRKDQIIYQALMEIMNQFVQAEQKQFIGQMDALNGTMNFNSFIEPGAVATQILG